MSPRPIAPTLLAIVLVLAAAPSALAQPAPPDLPLPPAPTPTDAAPTGAPAPPPPSGEAEPEPEPHAEPPRTGDPFHVFAQVELGARNASKTAILMPNGTAFRPGGKEEQAYVGLGLALDAPTPMRRNDWSAGRIMGGRVSAQVQAGGTALSMTFQFGPRFGLWWGPLSLALEPYFSFGWGRMDGDLDHVYQHVPGRTVAADAGIVGVGTRLTACLHLIGPLALTASIDAHAAATTTWKDSDSDDNDTIEVPAAMRAYEDHSPTGIGFLVGLAYRVSGRPGDKAAAP